jgi:hypothetical protein
MSFYSRILALGFAAMLMGVTGCMSSTPSSTSSMAPTKAILITTGQGTTAVLVPNDSGGVTMLANGKIEKCAQCEADVATYFKTGHIDPKCPVCGATRTTLSGIN